MIVKYKKLGKIIKSWDDGHDDYFLIYFYSGSIPCFSNENEEIITPDYEAVVTWKSEFEKYAPKALLEIAEPAALHLVATTN